MDKDIQFTTLTEIKVLKSYDLQNAIGLFPFQRNSSIVPFDVQVKNNYS